MKYRLLREKVRQSAITCHRRGPGYAQQSVVLQQVVRELTQYGERSRVSDSQILTCWHDLFLSGELSWGYDLDNPTAPFFHVPAADDERAELLSPLPHVHQLG